VATALNASWSDYQPAVGTSYSDRQVTPEEEEEEEEEFVVETVCGARVVEGVMEFRVKWQGYDSDDDTWEPEGNLTNCSEKVEAFVKGKGKAQTPVVSKKHTARTPAAPRKSCTRQCSECGRHVQLARASQATTGTNQFRCSGCRAKAQTVRCTVCNRSVQLKRPSKATTKRGYQCSDCRGRHPVSCVGCNKEFLLKRASRATGEATGSKVYRCEDCRSLCPVCGKDMGGAHLKYQARYSHYESCADCTRESGVDVVGGDLLRLARASPAGIVGAARLARYAHELESSNQLPPGQYEALLTRAKEAVRDHMYVRDADKVALADKYEKKMMYKGHCCAVCGVRDVDLVYTEIFFDPCDNGCATTVSTAAGLPANSKKRPVQLRALPDWLRVSASRITELQSNVRSVYVEHDDAPGAFIETQLSALDMRHITRLCGDTCQCTKCYVHLIEEAVDTASTDNVALMYVCSRCVTAFPSAGRRRAASSTTATDSVAAATAPPQDGDALDEDEARTARKDWRPVHSMAKNDYGRRYLSVAAVDRLRNALAEQLRETRNEEADASLAERLFALPPRGWRLPVASGLEEMLLAKAYLHIVSFKVADGASGGVARRRHATMQKHTVYFPLSLLDADNVRHCEPWRTSGDAVSALKIAVQRIPLVFVGSDGNKFDRFKRAALSMQQMRLRPKVVYTLLVLQSMTLQEKTGDAHRVSVLELAELEEALSADNLSACVTPESISKPPGRAGQVVEKGEQDVAHVRSDRGCNPSGADHDCDGGTSGRGCGDGGSSCSGQRHSLPHERAAELEEEPIAGVSDVGDAAQDVMHGVARLLQRGGTPMDDYGGQPQMLYDAHFSLFPIQEGLELGTKLSVHKTRHMMLFYDCRFAQDLSLLFGLADTLSRHAVHKAVHVQARTTPHAQKEVEELMKDGELRDKLRRACQDPRGEEAVALVHAIMPFVKMSCRRTPYTDGSRAAWLGTLLAHHRSMGPSCRALMAPLLWCRVHCICCCRAALAWRR
jgi:hypothetical protein